MNEETIFEAAIQKPNPAERAAYLEGACGGDPELRRRVEALVRAHQQSGGLLDSSASDAGSITAAVDAPLHHPPIAEGPGARIGPDKLLQQIGEGGMGVVYMAEQLEPVRRRVALKIIKPGMDTRQVVARFEAERQALAMMDHQNIAKVLDAGTTDSGRPYFVMELVHGVPITEFCDDQHLTPRERLVLFVPVCRAIQHAHQKGVIHRDIKPSNVLVTMYDDKPVPKVIDFGVAKAIEQRLTERTMFTQYGALVGTFEYMSPEQAEMNAFGVDTRSDIYVERCLADEPVEAGPPGHGYRLGKFARKYKKALATAAAFAGLLVAAAVMSTLLAVWATSAEKVAKRAALEANQQRLAAEVAKQQALEAKTESDRQRDQVSLTAYASGMGLAQRAWEEGNLVRARELLAEVPREAAGRKLRGFEWFYLSRVCHPDELTLAGHAGWVTSLAFSPNGQRVASGSTDQTVKIWDSATGKELFALKGHAGIVHGVAFSPDGQRLASASNDQTVKIWDNATGKELLALKGHAGTVSSVAFSPDGQRLASANGDGPIHLWETMSVSREIQHRRATNQMVADLFGQMPLRVDVLERLRTLPGMSGSLRQDVVAVAQTYPEDPSALNNLARELVNLPGGEMSGYRKALRYTEEACQLEPEDGSFLSTLGVAYYRVGNYEKALDVLVRSDKINALKDKGSGPADLALLAMTHHELGHAKEADAKLELLRERMKAPRWAQAAQAHGFLREAEELLAKPKAPRSK